MKNSGSIPTTYARRADRLSARGFTLLEILISLLVLSFGMLAMVGLQATALHSNREARLQSSAVRYGRELAELMRGNKTVANSKTNNPYLVTDFRGPAPGITTPCMASPCADQQQVASSQMDDWLTRVSAELPGARVVVCFDDTPYNGAGLPQWTCGNSGSGTIAIKLGWTQQSLDRGVAGSLSASSPVAGLDFAQRPSVVLQIVPGS